MKKNSLLIAGILSATILVQTVPVYAEDGASTTSKADIEYIKNTGGGEVVDPTDPTSPLTPDPTDPPNEGTDGPLSIDYVSNIHFSKREISGNDAIYFANLETMMNQDGETVERPNFIQVTDNRGSNVGWHLVVKQERQLSFGSSQLDGAQLTLENGLMNGKTAGITAPTVNRSVVINPGTSTTDVVDAKVDQGMGTWVTLFGQDNEEAAKSISLSVPGKTKKVEGIYTSELTWILTDTPA